MSTTWRMCYRFRLAKPLSAQDEAPEFQLGQRPVTLKSRTGGPLRDARYLVCLGKDFESEAGARAFGGRLRHALLERPSTRGTASTWGRTERHPSSAPP
jgi:hypothetical protein